MSYLFVILILSVLVGSLFSQTTEPSADDHRRRPLPSPERHLDLDRFEVHYFDRDELARMIGHDEDDEGGRDLLLLGLDQQQPSQIDNSSGKLRQQEPNRPLKPSGIDHQDESRKGRKPMIGAGGEEEFSSSSFHPSTKSSVLVMVGAIILTLVMCIVLCVVFIYGYRAGGIAV